MWNVCINAALMWEPEKMKSCITKNKLHGRPFQKKLMRERLLRENQLCPRPQLASLPDQITVIVIPMTVGKTDQIRRLERRMALKLRPKLRREGRKTGDPVAVQGVNPDHLLPQDQ